MRNISESWEKSRDAKSFENRLMVGIKEGITLVACAWAIRGTAI